MLTKIISGGQTGVDIAALRAAKAVGLETGGWMPKGFKTEAGPRSEYASIYGMREMPTKDYPARTRQNITDAQGTFLTGTNINSPGGTATQRAAKAIDHPLVFVRLEYETDTEYESGLCIPRLGFAHLDHDVAINKTAKALSSFINKNHIEVLNVAGNRDEELEAPIEAWLTEVFRAIIRLDITG